METRIRKFERNCLYILLYSKGKSQHKFFSYMYLDAKMCNKNKAAFYKYRGDNLRGNTLNFNAHLLWARGLWLCFNIRLTKTPVYDLGNGIMRALV